jgi:hypothetical protein
MRRRVYVLIALQILVPLLLLAARWADPEIGQRRFGWQMHTNCWGAIHRCE